MSSIRVENRTRGTLLGSRVRLADSLASRLRGFLFRTAPAPGEGILLTPCQGVHMFGVHYPLDVIFIDDTGRIVRLYEALRPWRWTPVHQDASHALEVPAGTIHDTGTEVGDALTWSPNGRGDPHDGDHRRASSNGSNRGTGD